MSKKKFTAGLESLFEEFSEETTEKRGTLSSKKNTDRSQPKASEGETRAGKDFTSDLQSFLEDSFEESLGRQLKDPEKKKGRKGRSSQSRRPTGLDALIRRTVEESAYQSGSPHDRFGKRITLLLDQEKLEKLKEIARQERTLLRNIIDEIVAGYIEAYEESKGKRE